MFNKTYSIRKYNGVNHDVSLYIDTKNYTINRKGQYFLTNQNAIPDEIIHQVRPLSVQSQLVPIDSSDTKIFLPEAIGSQIETLPNPYDYDIIIVSSRYADIARQTQGGNPEYLDRLYTPITLYSGNPQYANGFTSKIGCVGFRKVWYPRTPQEYVTELRAGRLPSVASMKTCVEIYNTHRAYCDFNTSTWLRELESYLSTIYTTKFPMKGVC